jgi:beta-amylase
MNRFNLTINAIGQLIECDPNDLDSERSRIALKGFEDRLWTMFNNGCHAVKTDVWWGLIEPEEGNFVWGYYRRIGEIISSVRNEHRRLKWIPGMSFHECGFNTGDDVYIPLPKWVFRRIALLLPGGIPRDVMFVSEQGHYSAEYVSFWVTDSVMPYYERALRAFKANIFDEFSDIVEQVDAGTGPSGEIRYPSYNRHDSNVDCPEPGALQCYSMPALIDFRKFVLGEYGTFAKIDQRWSSQISNGQDLRPPDNAQQYRESNAHNTDYGRTLHRWYCLTLLNHLRKVLTLYAEIFPTRIGVKIPGVHWRTGLRDGIAIEFSDRFAELNAGLVWNDPDGLWLQETMSLGYAPLLDVLKEVDQDSGGRLTVILTCAEMEDEEKRLVLTQSQTRPKFSLARSLVSWVGLRAVQLGLRIEAENALPGNLFNPAAWDTMRSHLRFNGGSYDGLTVLRINQVADNPDILAQFARTADLMQTG